MEVKCAHSSGSTGRGVTRVRLLDTSLTLTDESLLTVRVNDTLWLTPGDSVGVGDEPGLTSADGVTIPSHRALGSGPTGVWIAGVGLDDTSLALADVALLTVRVYDALRTAAGDGVGLGDETGLTGADRVT